MAAAIPPGPIAADSLGLAIVASSDTPLLLLDDQFIVVAASDSFLRAFQIDSGGAAGHSVFALGDGEWEVPQLRSLLRATVQGSAEIDAYEMDLKRPGRRARRVIIRAHKLVYADIDHVRLLLALSDVTDARLAEKLKDDLLREKAVLLQELQHRVANSLQIIASVLLQSARRIPSQETRDHLYEAHSRVMSVAALQQQLAASRVGEVALRAYFTELTQSIGASMIRDHEVLRLEVEADDSVATSDVSVSLGLIVTELVINALKHAFPGGRTGRILVGYQAQGRDWTLSVVDDGVGMPADPASAKAGLGSSLVDALSKQLLAEVVVAGCDPGTSVSIIHRDAASAANEDALAVAVQGRGACAAGQLTPSEETPARSSGRRPAGHGEPSGRRAR